MRKNQTIDKQKNNQQKNNNFADDYVKRRPHLKGKTTFTTINNAIKRNLLQTHLLDS